jgi:hypothetical protein
MNYLNIIPNDIILIIVSKLEHNEYESFIKIMSINYGDYMLLIKYKIPYIYELINKTINIKYSPYKDISYFKIFYEDVLIMRRDNLRDDFVYEYCTNGYKKINGDYFIVLYIAHNNILSNTNDITQNIFFFITLYDYHPEFLSSNLNNKYNKDLIIVDYTKFIFMLFVSAGYMKKMTYGETFNYSEETIFF